MKCADDKERFLSLKIDQEINLFQILSIDRLVHLCTVYYCIYNPYKVYNCHYNLVTPTKL